MKHIIQQGILTAMAISGSVGLGYFYGNQVELETQDGESISILPTRELEPTEPQETKPMDGVVWIPAGAEPKCPSTHPIKGKFRPDTKVYYLTSHTSYGRVKPDICFIHADFAENIAGFAQKF